MLVVFRVRTTSVLTCCRHHVTAAAAGLRETAGSSSFVAGQRRLVHTAIVHRATNLLKKFLNKSKKKTWYVTPPQTGSSNPWAAVRPTRKRNQEDSHRCKVLNSLLFKAVNDLLTSGQVSHDLYNYSPGISKVSLATDFSSCRVFWKSSGESERDQLIQSEFDKNGPSIRYLIMSQQIMGGVPPLVFLRDKQLAAMVEVDKLLQEADFGPDPPDSLDDRHVPLSTVSAVSSAVVKPALFGVDHEALNRQISEWRHRSKGEELEETPSPELTQEQLSVLAEHRKQQIIKKRKKKAPLIDDDVTPRAFLLAQRDDVTSQRGGGEEEEEEEGEESLEEEGTAFKEEKAQLQELMSHEERKL